MKIKKGSKIILGVCLAIGLAIAFTGCASGPAAEPNEKDFKTDGTYTRAAGGSTWTKQ